MAFLCCAGLLLPAAEVSAKSREDETQFDIQVTYGYGNTVKIGRDAVFHVSVHNKGEAFSGTAELLTGEYSEEGYFTYGSGSLSLPFLPSSTVQYYDNYGLEKKLELAAGAHGEISFALPFSSSAPYIKVLLKDGNGTCVAQEVVELSVRQSSTEILAGVLTDDPESFRYMDGMQLSEYSNTGITVITLNQRTMEDSVEGLSMLDVLLVQDFDMDCLGDARKDAVRQFVQKGGILVLGGEETMPRGVPEVAYLGEGRIVSYPGSLKLSEENLYSVQGRQADQLFEEIFTKEELTELDSGGYYLNTEDYWNTMTRLDSIDEENIPGIGAYVFVLAVYVILAGPVVYLVLKKLKVRKYLWGCVGVLAVGFSAVIFFMGSATRFNAPFINYVRTLQLTDDGTEYDTVEFETRAPYNKAYSIYVNPEYTIMPISEGGYYGGRDNSPADFSGKAIEIRYGDEEHQVTMAADRAFTGKYFRAEKTVRKDASYGISGTVCFFDGKVSGIVENHTDYDMKDVFLFFRNHLIYLEDFPAGSRKNLEEETLYSFASGYGYDILSSCLGLSDGYSRTITEETVKTSWRNRLLNDCLLEGYSRQGEICRFAGFTEDTDMDLMEDSAYKMYGQTMVSADMKLSFREEINGDVWEYAPFVTSTAEVISGNYDLYSNVYYSREAVLMYTLPGDLTQMMLSFGEEDYYDTEYYCSFGGTMELYNFVSGGYEQVRMNEEVGWDRLKDCISGSGQLMVRYQRVTDPQDKSEKLPVLIVKGRNIHAEN